MNTLENDPQKAIDPVCGMAVSVDNTGILATVKGQTYYFCAERCLKVFEKNPPKFMNPKPQKRKGIWGRYMDRLHKATGGRAQKCH